MLRGLINAGWEFTSDAQVHEYFKKLFTAEQVVNRDTGEIIEFPSSTALMDTLTFKTYTDKLREYAFEYLGMDIPEPDKYWKLHENVPDYILKELVRLLPVLIDNIDVDGRNTRLYNAVRLVKILIKKISKIIDYGR